MHNMIMSTWIWKWNPVQFQREIPQKDFDGILLPSARGPGDPHHHQTSDAFLQKNYESVPPLDQVFTDNYKSHSKLIELTWIS